MAPAASGRRMIMDKYIEREATIKLLRSLGSRDYRREKGTIQEAIKMVSFPEYTPSADVAPVRHGRWISVPHKLARVCSVCNRDEPYKFADIDADVYDYCPNCGAKMDGELNE